MEARSRSEAWMKAGPCPSHGPARKGSRGPVHITGTARRGSKADSDEISCRRVVGAKLREIQEQSEGPWPGTCPGAFLWQTIA
jgi:hypothetical protein